MQPAFALPTHWNRAHRTLGRTPRGGGVAVMTRSSAGALAVGLSLTSPQVGATLLGEYRLEQVLHRARSATVFLADDGPRSELVLLVAARDEEAMVEALAGPAAGSVVRRARLGAWWIAVVALNKEHIERFAESLFAVDASARVEMTRSVPAR